MTLTARLRSLFLNDWAVAFSLLAVFLAANGYIYGWDDQHLEIPLLKSLIDPSLYVGDYYVESLKQHFASYLYPLLARVITVDQIPAAYLTLYLLSRYFLFFWIYKIWKHITGQVFTAWACGMSLICLGRVEEFLYRTFSHQELALAGIFAALYLFYKDRILLAAFLLGLMANIHALYSLFPFGYVLFYLLTRRPLPWRKALGAGALFCMGALPFLLWYGRRFMEGHPGGGMEGWLELYRLACPQNFAFDAATPAQICTSLSRFWEATASYGILLGLWILNALFNPLFQKDRKAHAVVAAGALALGLLVVTTIWPNRQLLDFNLIRNGQFMLWILMGYTMILWVRFAETGPLGLVWLFALIIPWIRFGETLTALTILAQIAILALAAPEPEGRRFRKIFPGLLLAATLAGIGWTVRHHGFNAAAYYSLAASGGLVTLVALLLMGRSRWQTPAWRRLFVLIPLLVFSANFMFYHYRHLEVARKGAGFWQLQRNWIDMQNVVRRETPKNARLLVPYDMEMGGFRIFSERRIVVSYRDCGIIGFDYAAAVEWQKRIHDVEAFQVFIQKPIMPAVLNAIFKYKVNYIVFMGYNDPGPNGLLQPVYKNEAFVLYRVVPNPVE